MHQSDIVGIIICLDHPAHILLTGPTSLPAGTTAAYYCSTDNSLPGVVLDWSIVSQTGQEWLESPQEGVETYETALEDGGVQTHSVLTLQKDLVTIGTILHIKCEVRNNSKDLKSAIKVVVQEESENFENMVKLESVDNEQTLITDDNCEENEDAMEEPIFSQFEPKSLNLNLKLGSRPNHQIQLSSQDFHSDGNTINVKLTLVIILCLLAKI